MRDKPIASGLLQAGMVVVQGDGLALATAGAGVGLGTADAVAFCATRTGRSTGAPGAAVVVSETLVSETLMTGAASVGAACVGTATGAAVLGAGASARWAKAISETGPATFCAATIPNAARPTVNNAATTPITMRIEPSTTTTRSTAK
ncbi:MAG TPA: hypothetical protein VEK75_07700 [Xanthobacteraceae bacterium]|nr:hypothetical protein [Xanthobacteraceae bacterium]